MAKYYFIGTLLPPLSFDDPPEISFSELDLLFQENLTSKDYKKIRSIRLFFDILNLRALWRDEDFDPRGNFSASALEEALVSRVGLPQYVYEFMDRFSKKEDRLHHFSSLLAKFFQSSENVKDPFSHFYLNFERELRLILTAFRAKKLGRNLSVEFQNENPEEDLIAQILAQKDAKVFEPPEKYKELKVLFEKHGDDPLALQKALDEYRFATIEDFVDMADVFSINRLLAYFTQSMIIEKWFELDKTKGMQIVDTIVKETHYHETSG